MKKLTFITFMFCSFSLFSQNLNDLWKTHLSKSYVNCFEPLGNTMWVGTINGGAYQIDLQGNIIDEINFKDNAMNRINDIAVDNNGNIWFASTGRIVKYDGDTCIYLPLYSQIFYNTYNIQHLYFDESNNLWCCGTGTLARYDGVSWKTWNLQVNSEITDFKFDSIGNVWYSSFDGVVKFNIAEYSFEKYKKTDGLVFDYVNKILIDDKGNKWFLTENGVSYFNDTIWQNYIDEIIDPQIRDGVLDENGNLWLASQGGLVKFDGTKWSSFGTSKGLSSKYLQSVGLDINGNIWVGTDDYGINKFNLSTFQTFPQLIGLKSEVVYNVAFDANKKIYVATSNGIDKFSNGNWTNISLWDKSLDLTIDAQQNIWRLRWQYGVQRFNGTQWTTYTQTSSGIASDLITSVCSSPDTSVWFGSQNNGICSFKNNSWKIYNTTNSGIIGNNVNIVAIDNLSNIWIGTTTGLSVFDGVSWKSYTTVNGIINNNITAITFDLNNNLWIGTPSGISVFDGSTWKSYTSNTGLVSNNVTGIAVDKYNIIWVTTTSGLNSFDGTNWVKYFKNFTNCLLPTFELNNIYVDENNTKWICSNQGLTMFNENGFGNTPSKDIDTVTKYIVACENYYFNETKISKTGKYYFYKVNNITDTLTILYATINFSSNNSITIDTCSSFKYNNIEYTTSGIYTQTLINKNGCDSIISLTVTIRENLNYTIDTIVYKKFTYNDIDYFQSDNILINLKTLNGCDSIIYINLKITQLPGDLNGNNAIDSNEIIGDVSMNGIIDNNEIAGDIDGNNQINGEELVGDINGNNIIDADELLGDKNGNKIIDGNELPTIIDNITLNPKYTNQIIAIKIYDSKSNLLKIISNNFQFIKNELSMYSKGIYILEIIMENYKVSYKILN